jgi:hypothetical protein
MSASKINYYIYYDKNGAFLGALKKKGKPTDKNCKQVSEEEFNKILKLNHMPVEEVVEPETQTQTETETETETETPEVTGNKESEA